MLSDSSASLVSYFLSKDTAATEIYTLSLHDALPICIDRSAKEPYTTVEVLESLEDLSFRGECVVVQRYGETNVELEKALQAKGAEVVEIPTYRWALPENTGPLAGLIAALDRGEVDATVFTSASQAHNLF